MKALLSHKFRLNFSDDKNHNDIKKKERWDGNSETIPDFLLQRQFNEFFGKGQDQFLITRV